MSNENVQQTGGNKSQHDRSSDQPGAGSGSNTDVMLAKRTAIRQELAVALMAVGGALLAALIWANFSNN